MEGGDSVKIAVVDVARISLDREVQPEASDFSKVARELFYVLDGEMQTSWQLIYSRVQYFWLNLISPRWPKSCARLFRKLDSPTLSTMVLGQTLLKRYIVVENQNNLCGYKIYIRRWRSLSSSFLLMRIWRKSWGRVQSTRWGNIVCYFPPKFTVVLECILTGLKLDSKRNQNIFAFECTLIGRKRKYIFLGLGGPGKGDIWPGWGGEDCRIGGLWKNTEQW